MKSIFGNAAAALLGLFHAMGDPYPLGDYRPYRPKRPAGADDADQAAAESKRHRKAAKLAEAHFVPVVPTNREGAEFARGDIRRMDRRIRAKKVHAGSAAAAKARLNAARGDLPKRKKPAAAASLSPVPEDFFDWRRSKRRAWANQREIDRQARERDALVKRGVPFQAATARFGSL